MPTPSRWLIRISFLYLLVGMVIGAALLINKAYSLNPDIWLLLPIHIELLIFGWVIQFTMGTAYWILPRYLGGSSRGNSKLAGLMVVLLNAGITVVIVDRLASLVLPLALFGRILEATAIILFIALHWQRIVTYNG